MAEGNGSPGERAAEAAPGRTIRRARWWAEALAFVCAAALIPFRHGFEHSAAGADAIDVASLALAGFFALLAAADFASLAPRRSFLREKGGEAAILGLFAVLLCALWAAQGRSFRRDHLAVLVEIYLALNLLLALVRVERALLKLPVRPVQVFAASFAVLILVGACLLRFLPLATADGANLCFLDALFTATSAACVTGLSVVDTGTTFTALGQAIIAILIQIGALGIMTFAAFLGVASGHGLGLRERQVMQSALNLDVIGSMGRVVIFILVATFVIEAAGAAAIFFSGNGADTQGGAAWFAVFHSVSAFCNAGFSLHPDSYERYSADWLFLTIQMCLVVLGGLGFTVLWDAKAVTSIAWRALLRASSSRPVAFPGPPPRVSLHTKIVMATSAALVVAGAGLFLLFERDTTLRSMTAGQAVLASLFQSVSTRTAGFNSVPMGGLAVPTMVIVMVLMFIGASPGSFGGGVKTTTFAVLVLSVIRTFRGRPDVEVGRRRIPRELLDRATVLAFTYASLVIVFIMLLSALEPKAGFHDAAFEVVSAFGTVGLSTGLTPELSKGGRILITIAMFVGRLGPITLVIAMGSAAARARYEYPEGRVLIG